MARRVSATEQYQLWRDCKWSSRIQNRTELRNLNSHVIYITSFVQVYLDLVVFLKPMLIYSAIRCVDTWCNLSTYMYIHKYLNMSMKLLRSCLWSCQIEVKEMTASKTPLLKQFIQDADFWNVLEKVSIKKCSRFKSCLIGNLELAFFPRWPARWKIEGLTSFHNIDNFPVVRK